MVSLSVNKKTLVKLTTVNIIAHLGSQHSATEGSPKVEINRDMFQKLERADHMTGQGMRKEETSVFIVQEIY